MWSLFEVDIIEAGRTATYTIPRQSCISRLSMLECLTLVIIKKQRQNTISELEATLSYENEHR